MSEDLGRAIGAALRGPFIKARLSRQVKEASGYLEEEEKLVAPVAQCTRGGRKPLFLGLGIFVGALVAGIFTYVLFGDFATSVVVFGGWGIGLLVMCLALPVTHKHAVALTDRRLIVFRRSGVSGRHIVDVFAAVPRSDVSTSFKKWLGPQGWGVLSLDFAPSTGKASIQLDFWSIDTPMAEAIHHALAVSPEINPQTWSRAENDLERVYAKLTGSLNASRGIETRTTFGQRFKVLFLIRPLRGWPAEVIRIFYYASLAGVVIWISSIAIVSISRPSDWGAILIGLAVFLIANILISAGSYMLVQRLDRRARAAAAHRPEVQVGSSFRPSS